MRQVKRERTCEYPGRSCRRQEKMRSNNERQEVSRGHSTGVFPLGRAEQSLVPSRLQKEVKAKLKELTSRSQGRNVRVVMQRVKVYIRGWLGYFGIASMKTTMQRWDEWLRRRFRCYIWKQWKRPGKRARSLIQLGIPEWQAWAVSNCRKAYWHMAKNGHVQRAISKERLVQAGYYSILDRYESLHLCD